MIKIDILEKADDIRWDEVQNVIYKAHEENRRNGVDIRNAHLSPKELQESLGKDGRCFIALDGEKIVGTCSVAFQNKKYWFANGVVAYATLEGVLSKYKGQHIFKQLAQKRLEYIISRNCSVIYMNVAEKNFTRRVIAKKEGFRKVSIHYNPYNPHNYITYCKWIGDNPFTEVEISIRYGISMVRLGLQYLKRKLTK